MGWGSAGETVFIPTIETLIESGVADDVLYDTAVNLINNLQQEDWDTESESLEHFKDNPTVVRAFASLGILLHHSNFERLSNADLMVMRGLYENTTKLIWSLDPMSYDEVFATTDGSVNTVQSRLLIRDGATKSDMMFIAYAHTYVPKLLGEIDRLRNKLRQEYDETEP